MKTFIKALTTGEDATFSSVVFDQFTQTEKITHLVRQCWGMKYLKLVYGDDLWFLFKAYEEDLRFAFTDFRSKVQTSTNTPATNKLIELGLSICSNALNDPVISIPIGIEEVDFARFYKTNPMDRDGSKVPVFGSSSFATTLYVHLKNMMFKPNERRWTNDNFKASVLVPYNPLNPISAWREVPGRSYKYDVKKIETVCEKMGIEEGYLVPFLQLLVSIDQASYLDSPEAMLAVLATFMIDPTYITDYSGYVTAMSAVMDNGIATHIPTVQSNLFKGCYRVLFDEIENSIFGILDRQCKVVVADRRYGFTKPLIDNNCAKNLLWLLCYIKENAVTGFQNNNVLSKLITYFEPRILPANIPELLSVLHKVPDLTQAEQNLLLGSGFGSLFSAASPFSMEADEETGDDEKATDDPEAGGEKKQDDDAGEEMPDIDDGGVDPDATGGDDNAEGGSDDGGEVESSDGPQVLPEYLLEIGAPPDLDNVLYRMELDRHISLIVKNPPKNMKAGTLKTLQQIQSHWIHIVSLPILKLVIDSLFKKGTK